MSETRLTFRRDGKTLLTAEQHRRRAAELRNEVDPQASKEDNEEALMLARQHEILATLIEHRQKKLEDQGL